ncbi:MAG: metallophosphoesterase, partial [Clostridia bacterium]
MTIYAISDLHLPGGDQKEMVIFGAHWVDHFARICADWRARVTDADLVLLPGDMSWAMHLEDALPDLRAVAELPGKKILLRGNHDYWWSAISRLRASLPPSLYALQNDAITLHGVTLCGTRGWTCPGDMALSAEDEKIYQREIVRLQLSLCDARRRAPTGPLLAMMHYPPFNERQEVSPFTRLFTAYGVTHVVYGHLHGASLRHAFSGMLD